LLSGLLAKNALKQLNLFDEFISVNLIIPMTEKSARISSELYSTLKRSGKIVDDVDLFIAGTAIENDMILAMNNDSHFGRIPGLIIENWEKDLKTQM
jgi:tRNA(fMet)-specific endonuclease VapC